MSKKSEYSIKVLLPLFSISLFIGISSGALIGYYTPDDLSHIYTAIETAIVSVGTILSHSAPSPMP